MRTRSINSALGKFKQFRRMICHSSKENCYINPSDENYLRNFKTNNGERGTLDNLKDLLYLKGNMRRNFNSFLVSLARTRFSDLKMADNYEFLLQNGLSATPEDIDERAKRHRSTSSHRGKVSKQRKNNNKGEERNDLRDRLDRDRAHSRR